MPTANTPTIVDKGCPMVLGGPLAARHGSQGCRAGRGRAPRFADYAQADRRQRPRPGRRPAPPRRQRCSPAGTDNHLVIIDVPPPSGSPAAKPNPPSSTPAW